MDSWCCNSLQEFLQGDKMKPDSGVRMNAEDMTHMQENAVSLRVHTFSDKALEEGKVEVELVEAEYVGPNCVVFSYFEQAPASEVDKHFNRSLSQLCKDTVTEKKSNGDKEASGKPMHERNFPRSFWHPEAKLLSQQVHIEHAQSLPAQQYQRANPRPVFNHVPLPINDVNFGNRFHPPQCHQTASYSDFSAQRSNPISNFGYIRMPRPHFTNDTLNCHAEPRADVITGATRIYGPRIGHGFNPRYNSLLIQPEVNPQLPRIPGEPRSS